MKKCTKKEIIWSAEANYKRPVKMGDKGEIVKRITYMLAKHGSTVKMTEVFHIGVRSAVIAFQKKNKLTVTGVVDKKTWAKLAL